MKSIFASRPFPKAGIPSRAELMEHLRVAWTLELSTLPPYLTALWSIQDTSSDAYAVLKSVALEEMLHMMLVTNLYNSIGGRLSLEDLTIPSYPGTLPHAGESPWIQISPASTSMIQSVFVQIEHPADQFDPPPQGDDYSSIGQFYAAIEDGFKALAPNVFEPDSYQIRDTWFGGGSGVLIAVRDLKTALLAIREIVAQGEGARPFSSEGERWGERLGYGERQDGTYGPIYDGRELSHYAKLQKLALGELPLGSVFPMAPNPDSQTMTGEPKDLAMIFDDLYTLLIRYLVKAFSSEDNKQLFFTGAIPVMHTAMPPVARLLLATPLDVNASSSVGPNAGPGFRFGGGHGGETSTANNIREHLSRIIAHCRTGKLDNLSQGDGRQWATTLSAVNEVLASLPDII